MLQQLPIEVADGLRKEQLKKSELGKVVMFLYRLPDESQANRRIAKVSCLRIIARWSVPSACSPSRTCLQLPLWLTLEMAALLQSPCTAFSAALLSQCRGGLSITLSLHC